ncbi:acyl-CoA dehydratase activase-related protein, partial [Parabacteroides sp. OttesenSCG-928-N08]|nr:acyl-CoA dehydratase activase-related protein [Parabacteroides sp. OttesenSCG-928-N08]
FENGNSSYAGNKCEKLFYSRNSASQKGYNAFEQRNALLFDRQSAVAETNPTERPLRIGIPRILNMFDNYPFWHTLLTHCGIRVELSSESTFALYQKGAGSIMSENICFPAKLAHGHVMELIERGVDRIFYPIVPKEEKEFGASVNSFNCPIVSGYPDVIRSAIDPEERYHIPFDKPVITLGNHKALEKGCKDYLKGLGVPEKVIKSALIHAIHERDETKRRLTDEQKRLFMEKVAAGELVFVVAGRPYHTDPLINQKTGQILVDLGVHVFTDDVFRHERGNGFSRLNIISQWSYPNRMVEAAMEVAKLPANVQYIQLNSFGCGPDSFFMDEVGDILKQAGKNHTILRIDEIASPGSIRLRLRSLIESLKATQVRNEATCDKPFSPYPTSFKKNDREKTILIPWFADFISPFLPAIGELAGYKLVNLPKSSKASAEIGLHYGHNEVCYPSTLVLGDIIMGLQSGRYDLENTVVAISQTGGQCRATNYIAQIKRGMQHAGFGQVPVLAISTGKVYQNDQQAFKVPVVKLVNIILYGLLYADGLQQMYSSCIVREKKRGETQALFDFYVEQGIEAIRKNDSGLLMKLLQQAVADFNQLPLHEERSYTKIGLIGEIYLKYNNYGQAHITEWLREREMEVQTPPIMDFVMPYFVNATVNATNGVERDGVLNRIFRSAALTFV